jgi:hypothetical protein
MAPLPRPPSEGVMSEAKSAASGQWSYGSVANPKRVKASASRPPQSRASSGPGRKAS